MKMSRIDLKFRQLMRVAVFPATVVTDGTTISYSTPPASSFATGLTCDGAGLWSPSLSANNLPPSRRLANAEPAAQASVQASAQASEDKALAPQDAPVGSLRQRLIQCMTSSELTIKRLASELLFELCLRDGTKRIDVELFRVVIVLFDCLPCSG